MRFRGGLGFREGGQRMRFQRWSRFQRRWSKNEVSEVV